jgi:opacity protein-like surface antigen
MTRLSVALALVLASSSALAEDMTKQIPDEYETTSALGTGLNNAGYASNDSHAAIRANPALLSLDKTYSVSGGYHWPSAGREFYQAGVVDSKTSSVAAGVSYTGYSDDYEYPNDATPRKNAHLDSPIVRRGVVGFAQTLGAVSIGAGATYVEAHPLVSSEEKRQGDDRVRGFGLNVGVAGALTGGLRAGISAENLSNKRIRDYVPPTYRGGLAYTMTPAITAFLDYRQRERVLEFEGSRLRLDDEEDEGLESPEQMVIASVAAQVQNAVRLLGSYGHALSDDKRRSLAGGIAIVNQSVSLSYTASRPYMARSDTHQAVALAIDMSM